MRPLSSRRTGFVKERTVLQTPTPALSGQVKGYSAKRGSQPFGTPVFMSMQKYSASGAKVKPLRQILGFRQTLAHCFHQNSGVLARNQHALSAGKRQAHKVPLAKQILQRLARFALFERGKHRLLRFRLRRLIAVQQYLCAVRAAEMLQKARGFKRRVFRDGFKRRFRCVVQLVQRHRIISSPFSGITAFIAAIAASIILSVGSFTVKR